MHDFSVAYADNSPAPRRQQHYDFHLHYTKLHKSNKSITTYSNSFENEMVKVIFLFAFLICFFEFDDDQSEFDDDLDLFTPTLYTKLKSITICWLI